jgi:hypothetical protein
MCAPGRLADALCGGGEARYRVTGLLKTSLIVPIVNAMNQTAWQVAILIYALRAAAKVVPQQESRL